MTHPIQCRARSLTLGAVAFATFASPLRAQTVDSAATGTVHLAPGLTSPTRVGFARTIIDSAEIANAAATTLTELLTARAPSVSVFRASGAATASGTIRMRGAVSRVPAYPLLIVDGIRMDAAEEDSIAAASRLDDIPLTEIQRIEILPGAAAATLYGSGAASGVIIVTTRGPSSAGAGWRVRTEAQGTSLAGRIPSPEEGFGIRTDSGTYAPYCALLDIAYGLCTQTGIRHGQLDTTKAIRTGSLFGVTADWSGALGALARSHLMATSQHVAGAIRREDLRRRGGALDLASNVGPVAIGTRASFLRDRSTASSGAELLTMGELTSTDTASQAYYSRFLDSLFARSTPQEASDNLSLGASASWLALPWLRVSGNAARNRIDQHWTIADSGHAFDGHYERTRTESRVHGQYRGVVEASQPLGGFGAAHVALGYEMLDERLGYHNIMIIPGFAVEGGSQTKTRREAWFGSARFSSGTDEAFVLGLGGRYETDPLSTFGRWRFHPTADASVLAGSFAGVSARVRAAYGEATERLVSGWPVTAQGRRAELQSTTEGGLDLEHARGGLAFTLFSAVTHDPYRLVTLPASPAATRFANRGMEVDAHALLLDRESLQWNVRAVAATLRNRVTGGYGTGLPIAPVRGVGYTYADANSDGIITIPELTLVQGDTTHPSLPTFEGSLETTLTVARRVTLGGLVDRRSGFWVNDAMWAAQCRDLLCAPLNEIGTPLADQARALAAALVVSGYAERGDFTRLRELWIRTDLPVRLTSMIGASSASITLSGRNLFTWTSYRGSDPEANTLPRVAIARADYVTVPLPRELSLRLDIGR